VAVAQGVEDIADRRDVEMVLQQIEDRVVVRHNLLLKNDVGPDGSWESLVVAEFISAGIRSR